MEETNWSLIFREKKLWTYFDQMCQVLDQGNIEYVKWDMNRSLMDVFSMTTKDQGRVMYDYVIGLYDFLESIVSQLSRPSDRRLQWRWRSF